jgi:hypothetical protein
MWDLLIQFLTENQPRSEFSVAGSLIKLKSPIAVSISYILLCFISFFDLNAQSFDLHKRQSDTIVTISLPTYAELGHNNISDGLLIKTAFLPTAEVGKWTAQAGLRFDIISNNEDVLSGISLLGARNFMIRSFPLEVQGLYVRAGYYNVIHETNWGLFLRTYGKHIKAGLGTNFRTLALNNSETENLADSVITKIHEDWNLMYLFSYYIKPLDHKWNISLSVTNFDYFDITQETNPVFKIAGFCDLGPGVTMFIDAAYENAGLVNINLEYFGFYIKAGVIWKIWEK